VADDARYAQVRRDACRPALVPETEAIVPELRIIDVVARWVVIAPPGSLTIVGVSAGRSLLLVDRRHADRIEEEAVDRAGMQRLDRSATPAVGYFDAAWRMRTTTRPRAIKDA
jgi:hypothetical protein